MRKIAREAVIFALLGAVLASIWFLIQESRSLRRTEMDRALSDARAAAASDDPAYRILFIAQNVDTGTRTEGWRIFWESKDLDEFTRRLGPLDLPQPVKADLWEAKAPCPQKAPDVLPPDFFEKKKNTKNQNPFGRFNRPAEDKWEKYVVQDSFIPDYCGKIPLPPAGYYDASPSHSYLASPDSLRWPEPRTTPSKVVTHSLPPALFIGFIVGFPSGLGTWLFYRLVRFAIKG